LAQGVTKKLGTFATLLTPACANPAWRTEPVLRWMRDLFPLHQSIRPRGEGALNTDELVADDDLASAASYRTAAGSVAVSLIG